MKTWDKEFLLKKKNNLTTRYCACKNKDERIKIGNILDCIEDAINYLNAIDTNDFSPENIDVLKSDKEFYDKFRCYMGDIQSFFTTFCFNDIDEPKDLEHIETSKGKILTVTKEFYDDVRESFSRRISNLENSGNLRFRLEKKPLLDNYDGQTFEIAHTDMVLVSLNQKHTIEDYYASIHEFGHVLGSTYYRDQLMDTNKYLLWEVYPLFFELVGYDNIPTNNKEIKNTNRMAKRTLLDTLHSANIDTIRMELVRNIRRFDNIGEVRTFIKKEYECDDKDIDNILDNNLAGTSNYVFAYIIAVELYMEYLKNKDSALDKLVRIMKLKNLSSKQYYEEILKMGIIPLSSMGSYIDRIKGIERIYGK